MRSILTLAMLLLGLSSAATEPEYWSLLPGSFQLEPGTSSASLVEIESSIGRSDREALATPPSAETAVQTPAPASAETGTQSPAAATAPVSATPSTNSDPVFVEPPDSTELSATAPATLDELCNALLTSAEDNDLPVAFFANLIWQESGLRDDVVSSKGALGIAQFMPETAAESGLLNPFDPRQAIPASARLLRELRDQFGNLGLVAAAYNAGPRRVTEWLERNRTLPRETLNYVVSVTGHSIEQWKKAPLDDAALQFVRPLPCRDRPAFAELEQAQVQQAQLEEEQARQAQASQPQPKEPKAAEKADAKKPAKEEHLAERKHERTPPQHEKIDTAQRERSDTRHEAKEHMRHASHERHKSA
jgi:Transglycosylase SLT domain